MSEKQSLKKAEQHVFNTTFQDGLWDILIGCFVLMFAIIPGLSRSLGDFWSSFVMVPVLGLVYLGIRLLRRYLIRPRLGRVKFGSWRIARLMRFNLISMGLLLVALVLGIISAVRFQVMPSWMPTALMSLIFLIIFSLTAYFLSFNRLYLYGLLLALSPLVGEQLYVHWGVPHHGIPVTFGISAAVILGNGLLLFIRLMRELAALPDPPSLQELGE